MSVIELIKELIKMGYSVKYTKRKDGSYRITKINTERFTGSKGNAKARSIIGVELSEGRRIALSKLKTPKGKGSYNKRRKEAVPEEVKKFIRKTQNLYRKAGKKEGKPTLRNYRYILKTKGKEEADRLLRQSARRILGYAYVENVEALILRISSDLSKRPNKAMEYMMNKIISIKYKFLDRWIYPIYEKLYDWERGFISGEVCANYIQNIINS